MLRNEILNRIERVLINSNLDLDSILFKEAVEALVAIALKEIEDK